MLPTLNDTGSGRFGEDEGLGGRGDLLEGGLVAVVALGLADDDEVGLGQFAQGRDAGGLRVRGEGDFGVQDGGGADDPGVEEDMVRSWSRRRLWSR